MLMPNRKKHINKERLTAELQSFLVDNSGIEGVERESVRVGHVTQI